MFCPNCGSKNTTEQKYCRFCGLNIEPIIKTFQAQVENSRKDKDVEFRRKIKQFIDSGSLLLIAAYIILLFGNYSLNWNVERIYFRFLVLGWIILGVIKWGIQYFFKQKNEKKESETLEKFRTSPLEIKEADTAKLLNEPTFEPIPSVTENSTELLYQDIKSNKTVKLK